MAWPLSPVSNAVSTMLAREASTRSVDSEAKACSLQPQLGALVAPCAAVSTVTDAKAGAAHLAAEAVAVSECTGTAENGEVDEWNLSV